MTRKKKIWYNYNSINKILEVYYTGEIEAKDLIDYGMSLSNEDLPKDLNILVDASQAEYQVSRNEFPKLVNNLKRNLKKFSLVRVAFVQTKPKETAYSILYGQKAVLPNYVHRVFSTKEAAEKWLLQTD